MKRKQKQKQKQKQRPKSKNGNGKKRVIIKQNVPFAFNTRVRQTGKPTDLVIRHRDALPGCFLGMSDGSKYNVWWYTINPGRPSFSPWLSAIANHFETYIIKSMTFHYVPQCTVTTAGKIAMMIDYDPDDSNPETFEELLQNYGATTAPIYSECSVKFETNKLQLTKYYTSVKEKEKTVRTSDVGMFVVATESLGANSVSGIMWVEYELILRVPQTYNPDLGGRMTAILPTVAKPLNGVEDTLNVKKLSDTNVLVKNLKETFLTLRASGINMRNVTNPLLNTPMFDQVGYAITPGTVVGETTTDDVGIYYYRSNSLYKPYVDNNVNFNFTGANSTMTFFSFDLSAF